MFKIGADSEPELLSSSAIFLDGQKLTGVAKLRAYRLRRLDRLRGRKHVSNGGKFRWDLQGH
jgi:hypothetical protein